MIQSQHSSVGKSHPGDPLDRAKRHDFFFEQSPEHTSRAKDEPVFVNVESGEWEPDSLAGESKTATKRNGPATEKKAANRTRLPRVTPATCRHRTGNSREQVVEPRRTRHRTVPALSSNIRRRCRLCRRRLSERRPEEDDPIEVVMARRRRAGLRSGVEAIRSKSSWPAAGGPDFDREWRRRESNPRPRTHRLSVYKLRLPLRFARRPVDSRPTAGLAILWCRTSGDWLSVGAEPVF
jgi:hypothetical protein